jgi:transposase
MGKKRARLDLNNEAPEVVSRLRTEKEPWKKERLRTIKLLLETDQSYEEVASIIGRHPSRIKEWARCFRDGGITRLLTRGNGGGRKPKMSPEIQEAVVGKLRAGAFRTAGQIEGWLWKEYQLEYGKGSIYYVLGKLGGRLKVPRPSHEKKDPAKVEQFRTTLARQLQALDLPKDQEMSLWVYDEMRYGLHPLLRKMWSLVGTRVIAPVNRRFKWGYVFGAVEVDGNGSEFLYTNGLGKETDAVFLDQISASAPGKIHVIIGDGAGFHHKQGQPHDGRLPANVRILTLPPYSPELNPIEKLWDVVKDRICTVNWKDLEQLECCLTETLRSWWERDDGFSSLFTGSYLRTELNATGKYHKSLLLY